MLLPTFIKFAENAVNMFPRPAGSAAKLDEAFYPTQKLTPGERRQAMTMLEEQHAPEGSIFIVSSGIQGGFDLVSDPVQEEKVSGIESTALHGRRRAERVVEKFLEKAEWADIETVVIPGCGSSPLGAAALAKSVAEIYGTEGSDRAVAAILAGHGAFDQWLEAASGGMLMAPMANALNAFDPFLEYIAEVNPDLARLYIGDLLDAIHEAATLHALLKARLVGGSFRGLNMIVSHSKGNWAVLAALLALELELPELEGARKLREPDRRIDVVTFGNPVNLPDMHPTMEKLFHYHQFVGAADKLAHTNSVKTWQLHFTGDGNLDPHQPVFDPAAHPNERMLADTEHHLFAKTDPDTGKELKPYHMPIEQILPQIRPH